MESTCSLNSSFNSAYLRLFLFLSQAASLITGNAYTSFCMRVTFTRAWAQADEINVLIMFPCTEDRKFSPPFVRLESFVYTSLTQLSGDQ